MKVATFFKSVKKDNDRQVFAFNYNGDVLFFHTEVSTCDITGNTNCSGILGVTNKENYVLDMPNNVLSSLYEKAINFNVQTEIK